MLTSDHLANHKTNILDTLKEVGEKGISKSQLNKELKIKKAKFEASLEELEKSKEIGNIAKGRATKYVLREFYDAFHKSFETACELIENETKKDKIKLFGKKALKDLCPAGIARKRAEEAIKQLVDDQKLIQKKWGNSFAYFHVDTLPSFILSAPVSAEKAETAPSPELNREQVIQAYERVKKRIGFGFEDIEIYELQQELNAPMDKLKKFLNEESRQGRAVLSFGDWSLSSEEVRSGAIYIDGEPHLLVRFN